MHAPHTPQMARWLLRSSSIVTSLQCSGIFGRGGMLLLFLATAIGGRSRGFFAGFSLAAVGGVMASLLSARQSAYTTGGVRAHFRRQRRAWGDRVVTCLRHLASLNHDLYLHLHLRPALCPLPLGALAVPRGISS